LYWSRLLKNEPPPAAKDSFPTARCAQAAKDAKKKEFFVFRWEDAAAKRLHAS